MNPTGKRSSKRFTPTKWTERLVPFLLILLLVALLATLLLIVLSSLGLVPVL
jgi:hypothetical protein